MVMVFVDRPHLESVGSPLLAFHEFPTGSPELLTALRERIAAGATVKNVADRLDPAEWTRLFAAVAQPSGGGVALFAGLTEEETHAVVAQGQIIDCKSGDLIVHRDQTARTGFVILDGVAEVREDDRSIATMARGATFGEVSFLLGTRRIADVYAAADGTRVLGLSERSMRKLIDSESRVAARVLLNLSRDLARKLSERAARPRRDG